MHDVQASQPRQQGSMLVMRLMAVSVLVVAAVGATFSAHAHGRDGPGMGGDARGGMMMFDGAPGQVGRGIDRMLDGLNVSAAQRSQIKQIAMAAAADLKAQRDAARAMHEKGMQIFTAPTVDAAAAETLRQQMSAQHEQASKRMLQAMLDIAKVLTPEQRAKIGERMKERQAVMRDRMQRMQQERSEHGQRPGAQPGAPK
jgi:Spy/CpxP family protein refolding chaperone